MKFGLLYWIPNMQAEDSCVFELDSENLWTQLQMSETDL